MAGHSRRAREGEQERLMFETIHSGGAYSLPLDPTAFVPWSQARLAAKLEKLRRITARACALDRGNALADFEPASARRSAGGLPSRNTRPSLATSGRALRRRSRSVLRCSVQNTRHRTTSPLAPGAGTRCFVRHTSNFGPRTRHSRQPVNDFPAISAPWQVGGASPVPCRGRLARRVW